MTSRAEEGGRNTCRPLSSFANGYAQPIYTRKITLELPELELTGLHKFEKNFT